MNKRINSMYMTMGQSHIYMAWHYECSHVQIKLYYMYMFI